METSLLGCYYNNIKVLYGITTHYIDISDKFLKMFLKPPYLIIGKGTQFYKLFLDPFPGKVKNIVINLNEKVIYSFSEIDNYKKAININLWQLITNINSKQDTSLTLGQTIEPEDISLKKL